jgi:hypothetical protein
VEALAVKALSWVSDKHTRGFSTVSGSVLVAWVAGAAS